MKAFLAAIAALVVIALGSDALLSGQVTSDFTGKERGLLVDRSSAAVYSRPDSVRLDGE